MQKFIEGSVELGEARKATEEGNVCDGLVRGEQQGLGVAHSGKLDIVGERKAGDPLKLMGEIVAADEKFLGDGLQRNILRKMTMYIRGYAVYFTCNIIKVRVVGVDIFIPVEIDQA